MTCSSRGDAFERVLKAEDVSSFDTSLEKQEVIVKATSPYDTALGKIKRTVAKMRSGTAVE